MTTYFGFAVADSMFPDTCEVSRRPLNVEEVKGMMPDLVSCLNPSHAPTINAAKSRFGLDVVIPEKAPQVKLSRGDRVVVMSVRGLGRLENRHEYTAEEIEKATFAFGMWTVS